MALPLSTEVKAEAIALGLYKVTGRRPLLRELPGGRAELFWSEDDLPYVRRWFEGQADRVGSGAGAPDVSVDLFPVVSPYAARKVGPIALVLLGVGILLGRLL